MQTLNSVFVRLWKDPNEDCQAFGITVQFLEKTPNTKRQTCLDTQQCLLYLLF